MKIYALESRFLSRLLSDRKELLSVARSLGTAEAMRAAREDLIANARVFLTPKAGESAKYFIDADGSAHIPIVGELTPSARTDACGAYTAEALTEYGFIRSALAEAADDAKVSSLTLDVDSPGGYLDGLDEVAQMIGAFPKPVTAMVGGMAASAAYWLASQADKIIALSPASEIGSIGVAMEEYDDREALASEGIAHRVYTSTDAPDKRPDTSTDEGKAKIVAELDALHEVFRRRVAEGRGVSEAKVSKDFGRGGVLTAEKALAVGMIDAVVGSHIPRRIPAGVASSAAVAQTADISHKEARMDPLEKIKAEFPDAYKAAFEEGKAAGITAERARREQLLGLAVNAEADKAVQAAIPPWESSAEASAKFVTAALKGTGGDNPPAVGTATPVTASGAEGVSGLSAEDVGKLRASGMTMDEIKKYSPTQGKE